MRQKENDIQTIIEASKGIFAKYGYKKTTVDDIAHKLGISKGSLYNYFKSKQELYHSVVATFLGEWSAHVERECSDIDDPVQRLERIIFTSLEYVDQNEELQSLIFHDERIVTVSKKNDPYYEVNQKAKSLLFGALEDGQKLNIFYNVNSEHVTDYLFSTYMMLLIKGYIAVEGVLYQNVMQESIRLVMRGLVKPEHLPPQYLN